MSIAASLCHLTWNGVKVNLIDTPGEPSFQGDTPRRPARGRRGADGRQRAPPASRCRPSGSGTARPSRAWPGPSSINMLDRERADFDAAMARRQASWRRAPWRSRSRSASEAGFRGVVNLVSMTATTYAGGLGRPARPARSRTTSPTRAQAAREHLIDVVAENGRRAHREVPRGRGDHHRGADRRDPGRRGRGAHLPGRVRRRATRAIGVDRLLDLLVEALPSPATWPPGRPSTPSRASRPGHADEDGPAVGATASRPLADQFSGRISLLRVFSGVAAQRQPRDVRAQRRQGAAWASSSRSRARSTCRSRRSAPGTSARWPS